VILWTILPLAVVLIGIILISAVSFERISTRLVLERHRHLANIVAVSVSQVIDGYAHVLEALGSQEAMLDESSAARANALAEASDALDIFSSGVMVVDQDSNVIFTTSDTLSLSGSTVLHNGFPDGLEAIAEPVFSNVIHLPDQAKEMIMIAVPLHDRGGSRTGVLIGSVDLDRAPFHQTIQELSEPSEGYVYLVDNQGVIISHPDMNQIGNIFTDWALVQNVSAAETGENLWTSPSGERFLTASAQVSASGWSLIVKEPWEAVIATTRNYARVVLSFSLLAVLIVSLVAWRGVKRITSPIQKLVAQTVKVSAGEVIEPIDKSHIDEVDRLGESFEKMSGQIVAYRNGLRRYVGAITSSQEEERLRIARELHDEIIQNLLTISRKVELIQYTDDEEERKRLLEQLKELTNQTTQEVRQISQDLRPMMLEDLGLIPALRMLVHKAHEGPGAIPHADFKEFGNIKFITLEQELALYRITQEALTNVVKHAAATGVLVELSVKETEAQLVIQDDGKGFLVPGLLTELVQQGRLGLMGIQERVWAVDGKLTIDSNPEHGTKLTVTVPIHHSTIAPDGIL
jgi:signal transduction histidine kinase